MRFTLFLMLLLLAAPTTAQTPSDQDDVIRVETDITNLPFTATDSSRRFITTLAAEDIRVLEDGVPQKLFTFQRETDRPLALAFLIDVSLSQEKTLPDEKAAVRTFMENVVQSNKDQVAIIPFTGLPYLELEMTRDMLNAYRVLQRVEVAAPAYYGSGRPLGGISTGPGMPAPPEEGRTSINDAVALTADDVLAQVPGQRRRAMILLTDGLDTSSRLTRKDAIERALQAEAVIYVIGIGDYSMSGEGVDKGMLKDLAERTGGRAFFPKKEVDLQASFAEIEKELRTQYLLAYSSTNKKRDGMYRKITVEVLNPELKKQKVQLRYRPGYFARRGQ
ncbi:MAG TPA: VWA domain-containing protein [Pyrinomonadaceae bacterium]|nr:VWA domain-containing protein [Pyrinomonadaceae bacterium]